MPATSSMIHSQGQPQAYPLKRGGFVDLRGGLLAIDPGSSTGFAFGSAPDSVEQSGVWRLGACPEARPARLQQYIREFVAANRPHTIAYEIAAMGGKFQRAAARLSELTGAIQAAAVELGCDPQPWNIGSWKLRAVGKGNADKAAIMRALRTYFGIEVTDDNQADAIGIYLAATKGPPPEPAKKRERRIRKAVARMPRLF